MTAGFSFFRLQKLQILCMGGCLLSPKEYHRQQSVLLLCSEWEEVVPLPQATQTKYPKNQCRYTRLRPAITLGTSAGSEFCIHASREQNLKKNVYFSGTRFISTLRLNALPHLHLEPINPSRPLRGGRGSPCGDVVISDEPKRFLILRWASRLDAFSGYPVPTQLPSDAPGGTAGRPEVSSLRSSRTRRDSSQESTPAVDRRPTCLTHILQRLLVVWTISPSRYNGMIDVLWRKKLTPSFSDFNRRKVSTGLVYPSNCSSA